MADTPQLEETLRDAGLKVESIHLIEENPLIAGFVASLVNKACDRFSALGLHGHLIPATKYNGKIKLERIPEAVAIIRQRGEPITKRAVALELGCKPVAFQHVIERYPEIEAFYHEAVNDPLLFSDK